MGRKPLLIGITGGLGSGKSTVCRFLAMQGIPIYYADERASALMEFSSQVRTDLTTAFGEKIWQDDGKLDKATYASIIFSCSKQLALSNSIIHPAVAKDLMHWRKEQQFPTVCTEAAILFDSGFDSYCDVTVTISSPKKKRIKQIVRSRRLTEEEAMRRISFQWSDEEREKKADYVLYDTEEKLLLPHVLSLMKEIELSFTQNN